MPKSGQPEIPAFLRSYRLHIPNFAPVFHWLSDAGLTSEQVAAAFRIKASRVRAIRARTPAKKETWLLSGDLDGFEFQLTDGPLLVIPPPELRHELGISAEPDFVVLSSSREQAIRELETSIDKVNAVTEGSGEYDHGLLRMRRLVRLLGQPHSALLIRLLARIRHYSSWYLMQMGRARSAIDQARRAMALSTTAHHESGDGIDLLRMAETGLILSMGYALRNQPQHSLRVLRMVRQIQSAARVDPGSEYHRQRGTALLMLLADEEAEREFLRAAAKMRDGGASDQVILLYGLRQANLLHRSNWDGALATVEATKTTLIPSQVAYQTNMHWAAIAGLASGDGRIAETALEMLGPPPPVFVGHQATIRHLIEVTPKLKFSGEQLRRWTRYLMYANVFRDE